MLSAEQLPPLTVPADQRLRGDPKSNARRIHHACIRFPDCLAALGDKSVSKHAMEQAGELVVDGWMGVCVGKWVVNGWVGA